VLDDIEPLHVSLYIETLQTTAAKPTVKQHLAAIRMLFDWLVVGQILPTNPAHAVRGPKHVVHRGKTPFLTEDQARRLLAGLDTSTVVGLRDRALIGMMTYTFARIGAVVGMRVEDYFPRGKRYYVRLHEKGGKQHEMPVHHKRPRPAEEASVDSYRKKWPGNAGWRPLPRLSSIGGGGVRYKRPKVTITRQDRRQRWRFSNPPPVRCSCRRWLPPPATAPRCGLSTFSPQTSATQTRARLMP